MSKSMNAKAVLGLVRSNNAVNNDLNVIILDISINKCFYGEQKSNKA